MHEHLVKDQLVDSDNSGSDLQSGHQSISTWINRIFGMVVMFAACLIVCHAAGMIHIDLSNLTP